MTTEAVQLSHEELLLVLGLLRLPAPLALGPRPSGGYTQAELGAALSGALGSLSARGLVRPPSEPAAPAAPVEQLATLVRAVALAEQCLVVVERRGALRGVSHLSAHDGCVVLHTSPQPGVHRLAPLADLDGAADWLAALVRAVPAVAPLPVVAAHAGALAAALDAIQLGDADLARSYLGEAGVPPPDAAVFLTGLGAEHARFAIGVARGIRGGNPSAAGALALSGAAGVWWAATRPDDAALTLRPVYPAALRRELHALVARLA